MTGKRGYADGPYGQIHYQDTVEGHIPLILCSQSPMTCRQYDRVYLLLAAAGIRAIGIDTPGFGMSDPPPKPPIIADFAKVIPYVLDHLNLETAHLCGHHTGTKTVTEAAIAYPDRVRSLVLSSPAPMTREEEQQYIETALAAEKAFAPKADGSHLSELYVKRLAWIKDEADGLDLANGYTVQNVMGLGPFWYGHHAAFNYDAAEVMPKITQPVLALYNTGDVLFPMAERTMKLCPHFSYAEIEGGGINITDEKPEAWTQEVAAYLKGLTNA